MADRMTTLIGWAAVLVGALAEAVLIAVIDRLPWWGQVLVYGPCILALVAGFVILVLQRRRDKRRAPRRDAPT